MQKFSDLAELKLDLKSLVMHTENTAYCNYFIAKKKFWLHWLELGEKLFHYAESSGSDLSELLYRTTQASQEQLPASKILIQERLVNMVLAHSGFKSKAFNVFNMPGSVTPLNNFMPQAVEANALKFAAVQMGEPQYLDVYTHKMQTVWEQSGMSKLAEL
jgi:hypothetical protein